MSNHVDLPHAKLLKEAGWEKKTEQVYIILENDSYVEDYFMFAVDCERSLLWRPNLSELLGEITFTNFWTYFSDAQGDKEVRFWYEFAYWQDQTMRDPNALADVWLWVRKEKK